MAKVLDDLNFKTPMMQQYLDIKKQYPDCILLFRLGDFYEMFLGDAKIGSEVLGITLTSRSRGQDGRIPMCGVPYHAIDAYLGKLTKAGHKVAICEQMEDACEAKAHRSGGQGVVERDVVRVVTPGTVLDDRNLVQKENNYLLAIEVDKKYLGLAYADLSTGELSIRQVEFRNLEKGLAAEILRIKPVEVISSHGNYNKADVLRALRVVPGVNIFPYDNWESAVRDAHKVLREHFQVKAFGGFGIDPRQNQQALRAAAALLTYLKETQKGPLKHIQKLTPYQSDRVLRLGAATIANLELFSTLRGQQRQGTLIEVLDRTRTAAGGRKIRHWLLQPLRELEDINQRLDAIQVLKGDLTERESVQEMLARVLDIERLISRISVGIANPRDLVGLRVSLENVGKIVLFLESSFPSLIYLLPSGLIEQVEPLRELLVRKIKPEPPVLLTEGGYIADGVSAELDEYRGVLSGSKSWLKDFEEQERKRTGIGSLKVGYNKVFGFYIEVSKSNLNKVPPHYIRKQTLVNAERYIVPELKKGEETALQAEERAKALEKDLFREVLVEILQYIDVAQQIAQRAAELDVFCSLAEVAQRNCYVRPELAKDGELLIRNGRHPVIEQLREEVFVPNDTEMRSGDAQILLITGPNMAGKSTYLRQVALITLLAQMGSFVPADSAKIPIRDQIYTRVGATDNISLGQSTFLVEMMETANILNNCTSRSLVIFDEI
ncbi:DNA mismatch repair protein MutS, partial [Patescibacteria group bacterium]|nr:DNA mismatch repair protein MutS [Patescibacteria group bacterium]